MSKTQVNARKFNIARWVVYCLVAVAVVVPLLPFVQLPLPFKPSPVAAELYGRIDHLKPGSHVLLAFDFDPASQAELEPMSKALLEHCFKKGLIPIVVTHWPSGIDMDRRICETTAAEFGKTLKKELVNGSDWVFLGYRPGGSMLVQQMGDNLKGAFEKDFYGQPTSALAGLRGVNSLKNIDFAVDFAAGDTVGMWIAYGSDKFGFPLAAGTTAVQAPDQYPFLQSHQIVGLLGGLRGAADYESLVKMPGDATRGMQAQSAAHVLVIVLIIIANVRFIAGRLAGRRKG